LAISIAAKTGVIVATFKRLRERKNIPPVRPDLNDAAHLLYMLNGVEASEDAVHALDTALMLHCDHGFNNSTFSARVVASSLTDVYSAITAAIGALNGPLHGGANAHVLPMLEQIGEPELAEAWVLDQLAQKRVIMGIGHPVYKTVDPRKIILKETVMKLAGRHEAKLIQIAERVEQVMLREKGLHANVDLYSAPLFHTLGIPSDLFTPIFVISRMTGWLAHIMEQLSDNRIFRPESEYVGLPVGQRFVPLGDT
jgi:citrate synthase